MHLYLKMMGWLPPPYIVFLAGGAAPVSPNEMEFLDSSPMLFLDSSNMQFLGS